MEEWVGVGWKKVLKGPGRRKMKNGKGVRKGGVQEGNKNEKERERGKWISWEMKG